jgi:transcriptional regulator with XRE-family HTH domain
MLAESVLRQINDRVRLDNVSTLELAERMRCTRQNASRILNEGPKTFDRLQRVADALDCEVHITLVARNGR